MRIAKWGNSFAVRLPASLIKELNLREGEEVEIEVRKKTFDEEAFHAELRKIRAEIRLPADFKFDRDEANARR
jgi:antitoxin MazE